MTEQYTIDVDGNAVVGAEGLFELWYHGHSEKGAVVTFNEEVEEFNRQCVIHDKLEHRIMSSETKPLCDRINDWLIPPEYKALDVEEFCIGVCRSDEECHRVRHEIALYRERGLMPLLQALMYMVDTFRQNKIVWGVGRGSSVSSHVLFLIGVHKINSLHYDLKVEEFLR